MSLAVRRLLPLFTPKHYGLRLDVRHANIFRGSVEIIGTLPKDATSIILHAKDLTITKAFINDTPVTWQYGPNDELTLLAPAPAGTHTLKLFFKGQVTEVMQGLYPCRYTYKGQPKVMLATQFESHSAREVFPCIDEPAAKAIFELSLLTQKGQTVLSNTPIAKQTEDIFLVTRFKPTPPMSTYLLAFVVGELAHLETKSKNGILVRTFSTPEHIEQTRYVLNLSARLLDFYDDFFGIAYPLAKCDLVALPDFSAGAMENWGLITFRESCMFVDADHTPLHMQQYVANVTAHELAHQWFGNLVTMQWWDDLWLNESFANWMPYYVLDIFFPEWELWSQFTSHEQQQAFSRDSLEHIQAVRQPLDNPEQISSLFDPAIVYAKGSCLVRMAHQFVGDKKFRAGLKAYMRRHAFGNATMNDLWQALDIGDFMRPWVTQPGHAVVTVHQGTLHQRRFFAHPYLARDEHPHIWPIPLEHTSLTARSGSTKEQLINTDGSGFYHVLYDTETLAHLAIAKQPALFRQKLLQDELAIVGAGLETSATLLHLLEQYSTESNYGVWLVIQTVLKALHKINHHPQKLRPFVRHLCKNQIEQLGWQQLPNEPHFNTLLRPLVLELLVMVEDTSVLTQALATFDQANSYKKIPANARQVVYCAVAKAGTNTQFQKLLEWHTKCASAHERLSIRAGLACATQTSRIQIAIELFEHIKPQDVPLLFRHLMQNPAAQTATWQWMVEHWTWIKRTFGRDLHYDSFARYCGIHFYTTQQLAAFDQFFTPKMAEPSLSRSISQARENIEISIAWRQRDKEAINTYLTNWATTHLQQAAGPSVQ